MLAIIQSCQDFALGIEFYQHCLVFVVFSSDYKNKDNLLIYQSKINPPHYKVIVGTESWDIKKVSVHLQNLPLHLVWGPVPIFTVLATYTYMLNHRAVGPVFYLCRP